MTHNKADRGANGGHGMNWCRPERRLALYLRDGLACVYCGVAIEDGARLTLDHIVPRSAGGTNASENLITACVRCNSARGDRDVEIFAGSVAGYLNHNLTAAAILAHISARVAVALDVAAARELIARRGGFTAALRSAR